MTQKLRVLDVENYAYYVNKCRQNVGLETWLWRQIVMSQTAHAKYKWPPYATEWTPPMEIFCVRHCSTGPTNGTRSEKVKTFGKHLLNASTQVAHNHPLAWLLAYSCVYMPKLVLRKLTQDNLAPGLHNVRTAGCMRPAKAFSTEENVANVVAWR